MALFPWEYRSLMWIVGIVVSFPLFADDGSFSSGGTAYGLDIPAISGLSWQSDTTFPTAAQFDGWTIGGLSGIDRNPRDGALITVRDNTRPGLGPGGAEQTTLFTLSPLFTANQPGYGIRFTGVTPLNNPTWQPETNGLESVRYDPSGDGLWLSSESENVLYHLHADGTTRDTIRPPEIVTGSGGNTQLEGMTFSPEGALWLIREAPREQDSGITRITRLSEDGKVIAQYPYQMDTVADNGVSELLAVSNSRFLVMERAWDGKGAGTAPTGESHNSIRIYLVDIAGATDISGNTSLATGSTRPVSKTLIFDSKTLAEVLNSWDTKVDNVEGMSFGPTLPDGHTSLILVSDNNFSSSQRKTQFIILRLDSPLPDEQYWDGNTPMADGRAGGGDGVWRNGLATESWTREGGGINDNWGGGVAIFRGSPGTVTIDNSAGQVSARELRFLVSGYTIAGQALNMDQAGLTVNIPAASDVAVIDAPLTGRAVLTKSGMGTLILNGDSTVSGPAQLSAGRLSVNGTLPVPVSVEDGAVLGGNGRVAAIRLHSGATLAPGTPGAPLNAIGEVVFDPGSHFSVMISPDHGSDGVRSDGQITLNGADLTALSASSGNLLTQQEVQSLDGRTFRILQAVGGLNGRFSTVSPAWLFLDVHPLYDANGVTLTAGRNATAFSALADTPDARAVAAAADTLPIGHPVRESLLTINDPLEARAAFRALDGQLHANVTSALSDQNRTVREAIEDHLQMATLPAAARQQKQGLWGQMLGAQGNAAEQQGDSGYDQNAYGALFGSDLTGNNGMAGAALGYTRSSLDSGSAGSATTDSGWLAAYGSWSPGDLSFSTGSVLGVHRIATTREVTYGSQHDNDSAHYAARSAQIFADAAWNLLSAPTRLAPFVGASWSTLSRDGIEENGGAAALNADRQEFHSLSSVAGLRASSGWQLSPLTSLRLRARAGWQHTLSAADRDATLRFNSGDSFSVQAPAASRDALLLNIATEWRTGEDIALTAGWSGLLSSRRQSNSVEAGVRWQF